MLESPPPVAITQAIPPDYRLPAEDLMARARTMLAVPEERVCEASTSEEIVVCAPAEDQAALRLPPGTQRPVSRMQEIGAALNFKIGPVEVGSIDAGNGTRALGVRLKF